MKTRRKKKQTDSAKPTIQRVRVPTLELVEIRDALTIEDVTQDVGGKLVKLSPLIPSSERESFDGPALVAALHERGAIAVTLAPRIVADTVQPEKRGRSRSPRELVKEWFEAQHSIFSDAAEERVIEAMEAEGL